MDAELCGMENGDVDMSDRRLLTNEQRDKLAEAILFFRIDAAKRVDDIPGAEEDWCRAMLALGHFLESVGIMFDREDIEMMIAWNPEQEPRP